MRIFNASAMRFIGYACLCVSMICCVQACKENTAEDTKEVKLEKPSAPEKDTLIRVIDTSDVKYKKFPYLLAYDKALMLWNVPFEEKDLKTSYGNAHVIISGPEDGHPLVLLHGMNATSTMWYPNIKALSEKHRVYAIDFLLEPGKSRCEAEVTETLALMRWYDEIFKELKLEEFSILGASRGGWLATNIALHRKAGIKKLVLLSPAQTFTWIRPGSKVVKNLVYTMSPKRKKLRSILQTMTCNVDSMKQAYIDQYYMGLEQSSISKCFMDMTPFTDKELKSLDMPVLVLIGDRDIINNEKSLKRARRLIKHIEVGTIKNAGHFLSMDQADVINKVMVDFFEENHEVQIARK